LNILNLAREGTILVALAH